MIPKPAVFSNLAVEDLMPRRKVTVPCAIQEKDSGADKGKSRDKEAVKKEVLKLREAIQKVTKSANPLGRFHERAFPQMILDAQI